MITNYNKIALQLHSGRRKVVNLGDQLAHKKKISVVKIKSHGELLKLGVGFSPLDPLLPPPMITFVPELKEV